LNKRVVLPCRRRRRRRSIPGKVPQLIPGFTV